MKNQLFAFLICWTAMANGQQMVQLGFYNVENLFDTENDSTINDEEFLPEGRNQWTYPRYTKKLDNLARAIVALGDWQPIDVLGLCEVENERVVTDLARHDFLKSANYRVVHRNSPDRRGIDVALLVNSKAFDVIHVELLPVTLAEDTNFRTRSILFAQLVSTKTADTLCVFVNHWPSRSGGQEQSEPKRIRAAQVLKECTDSLFANNPTAKVVIMGDLNDTPADPSVLNHLGASHDPSSNLVNLMADLPDGSHRYRGHWSWLDQLIVSRSLLNPTSPDHLLGKASACRAEFLMEADDRNGGMQPFRTYRGPNYHGGFSDHLPVKAMLELNP